jgi:5-methyltetrahydrofolate--homocysteine methyltransferase
MSTDLLEKIAINVVQGRVEADDEGFDEGFEGQPAVIELVEDALEKGLNPDDILLHGLTASMSVVGEKFEAGEYLIPDMLAAAEAVGEGMEILTPHLVKAGIESKGKFVIATVKGDLHDIGKNIVAIMLKGAGYEVIDLGVDVPSEKIIAAVKEHGAPFLGLSALLTTTMRNMGEIIDMLKTEGLRDQVKIGIGGAPASEEFAASIGADAYCSDAFAALDWAKQETA